MRLLLIALAALPATAPAQSDTAAVHVAMRGFLAALAGLDTARMAGYFAPGITAFVPSAQAERVEGKPAVERIFAAFAERSRAAPPRALAPERMAIDAAGDLAVVSFQVTDAGVLRRRTFVWRRIGGRWLITHFHASDISRPGG